MIKDEDIKLLNKLGLRINNINETLVKDFCFINNTDNTIRWIYPKDTKKATFLNFYSASNFKSILKVLVIKLLFHLKLETRFFGGEFRANISEESIISNLESNYPNANYTIFTGTKGENRKVIIELNKNGETFAFKKVAISKQSKKLLCKEYNNLQKFKKFNISNIQIPEVLYFNSNELVISNIKNNNSKALHKFGFIHQKALENIYSKTLSLINWNDLKIWSVIEGKLKVIGKISKLENGLTQKKLKEMTENISVLVERIKSKNKVLVAYSHGDFTPWNIFINNDSLSIIDWELASSEIPIFYDFFHFVFQSEILLNKSSYPKILNKIQQISDRENTFHLEKYKNIEISDYYGFYLVHCASYYLEKYANQKELHSQAFDLISIWADALSHLVEKKEKVFDI